MLTRRTAMMGAAARSPHARSARAGADDLKLPRQKVELVAPPFVHPHEQATRQAPKIIEFRMEIEEKEVVIDEQGTKFQAMTFNGSMPGPMMVVHQGDYVELTLVNPDTNTMPHNIDFHSATGALGGGALTLINPGEQVVLRWKADRTGVFVYHCAPEGAMIPWHVVSGMHGTVMVLPRDGPEGRRRQGAALRPRSTTSASTTSTCRATRTANTRPTTRSAKSYADTMEVMRKLIPTHVVFNGKVGALTGKNAMTANVGETVMIVHSQANRDYPAASDRRARRPCVGDRQVREPAGGRSGDLVHPRRLGGSGALHVQAARHLRLREPQSDRGGRARRRRPLQGRGQMERRPDEAGEAA